MDDKSNFWTKVNLTTTACAVIVAICAVFTMFLSWRAGILELGQVLGRNSQEIKQLRYEMNQLKNKYYNHINDLAKRNQEALEFVEKSKWPEKTKQQVRTLFLPSTTNTKTWQHKDL